MATSQVKAAEFVRIRDGVSLREAHKYVKSVMADPQVDWDVHNIQQIFFAQHLREATEIVFQMTPLKWSTCKAIVRALHEQGKLIL